MVNYRSILYENNKMLDYMISLARLKPGETLHLNSKDRKLLSDYFNNKQKFNEFNVLIASSQFLNNYDDNNTFPSIDILKDLFDNGTLCYYDESNDIIIENYNDGNDKGIEIIKDSLKGKPDEYQRKFKIIRNAIAHAYYKIEDGKVIIDWEYGKKLGEEFSMKMDIEAFLSLTEVLTEKRFSKEPIDEIGYSITPSHYVSIDSENTLKNLLPFCMRKVIIDGSLSDIEKEEVKDELSVVLFKNTQSQRAKNISLRLNKDEKRKFKINDSTELLDMTNAFAKTSADLKHKVKFKSIKTNDPEIKYLRKYLAFYGDSFYKYGSEEKFTNIARRTHKNQMLLEILLLNTKDRLNINYSSFNLREVLLKLKKDNTPFEELGVIKFTGLAALKNILIPKAQLIFEQLRKNEQDIEIKDNGIFEFLKNSSLKVEKNGNQVNLFSSKSSPIGKRLTTIEKKTKEISNIKKNRPEALEGFQEYINDLRKKNYKALETEFFSHIRNSITHGHMEVIQEEQDIKVSFKDFKDEDDIPDNQKRERNSKKSNTRTPDFYCEISLDDFLKLCDYIGQIYFKEEDKLYLEQNIEGEKISKRRRFFTMSPVKPMMVRKAFRDLIHIDKDYKSAMANYSMERMIQHKNTRKTELLNAIRF